MLWFTNVCYHACNTMCMKKVHDDMWRSWTCAVNDVYSNCCSFSVAEKRYSSIENIFWRNNSISIFSIPLEITDFFHPCYSKHELPIDNATSIITMTLSMPSKKRAIGVMSFLSIENCDFNCLFPLCKMFLSGLCTPCHHCLIGIFDVYLHVKILRSIWLVESCFLNITW